MCIWYRDANGHFRERAPVEVPVDVENVAAFGSVVPKVVGAVEDLPSAVRAAADFGEAGRLGIGARAESRVDDKFGRCRLLAEALPRSKNPG